MRDSATLKKLAQIAREKIIGLEGRPDLERHYSDEEDFIEIAVWDLEEALAAAYELGKAESSESED